MGTQNVALLEEAQKKGGLLLSMRVAIALGAGVNDAMAKEDNPEKIQKASGLIRSYSPEKI